MPYTKGWTFKVHSHIPPPPTPVFRSCSSNDEIGRKEYEEIHPVERCLLRPPLRGQKRFNPSTVKLEIDDTLHSGEEKNAQVVVINVLNVSLTALLVEQELNNQKLFVAKIYDPLYFPDDDGYLNPFRCVDKHYTHEAVTYARLTDHGAYTLYFPVGPKYSLQQTPNATCCRVWLILISFVPGKSMRDVANPKKLFSQGDRKRIMKGIIDFDTKSLRPRHSTQRFAPAKHHHH